LGQFAIHDFLTTLPPEKRIFGKEKVKFSMLYQGLTLIAGLPPRPPVKFAEVSRGGG
jgi:hypothetical protein